MTTTAPQSGWDIELRPASPDDAAATFALFDADARNAVGMRHREAGRARALWARYAHAAPGLAAQVAVANTMVVGAALVPPLQGRTMALVTVHPQWRARGIGGALADWLIDHTTRLCRPQSEASLTLVQRILTSNESAADLLGARGWRHARSMARMERGLSSADHALPISPKPEIRPVIAEREIEALLLAEYLGFREAEAYDPADFALALARWKQRLATDPQYDPALWFVALAPDAQGQKAIAGVCLCSLNSGERDDMAWISRVAVRVPWRRQGLGRALLDYAFARLVQRGKRRVGLTVVAGNEAALTLYTRAGMSEVPALRFDEFELAVCTGAANGGKV